MPSTYFSQFAPRLYPNRDNTAKIVSDIFARVQFTLEAKLDAVLYYDYTLHEGDTPETIAYKYYGSPHYHWVVLLTNEIVDPFYDWHMSSLLFEEYVTNKYGATLNDTHHYETIEIKAPASYESYGYEEDDVVLAGGITCNSEFTYSFGTEADSGVDTFTASQCRKAITNYDYEYKLNESKQSIKLLNKDYLTEFLAEFDSLISGR